jgi:hypothetical protein
MYSVSDLFSAGTEGGAAGVTGAADTTPEIDAVCPGTGITGTGACMISAMTSSFQ